MFANAGSSGATKWGIGDKSGFCGGGPIYVPWYSSTASSYNCMAANTMLGNWNQGAAIFSLYPFNSMCFNSQFNYGTNALFCQTPTNPMTATGSAGYAAKSLGCEHHFICA